MQTYAQYCPILRASEVLGERWTFVILKNMFQGAETFTQIAEGAPGMPRSTLTTRLRSLERDAVIERVTSTSGRTVRYRLTTAGRELWEVCAALGTWGARWLDVAPEHCDPFNVLWSWSRTLKKDALPARRILIRFTFSAAPAHRRLPLWLLISDGTAEVCLKHPGFAEDLLVTADTETFTLWHLGRVQWSQAVRDGRITVTGPRALARALPTSNPLSKFADVGRAERAS